MSDSDSSTCDNSAKVVKKENIPKFIKFHGKKKVISKGGLKKVKKGEYFAYCSACHVDIDIKSGKMQLERHTLGKKHSENCESKKTQKSLTSFLGHPSTQNAVKDAEIKLCAFVVEHNLAMRVMDHMPNLLQSIFPDSNIAKNIKCARTKTTNIIKHVLGRFSKEKLISKLKITKFSLIIHESTDRTCKKQLCLLVRVFCDNAIQDSFLSLLEVENAHAESLFTQITDFFHKNNIDYKQNMIGFAADGANVMMGRYNSVAARFSESIPNLFILKCICHSFHLIASYACAKIPNYVEQLTRHIYNYFSNSPKRVSELKEFQEFVQVKIHKILHPSQTRWMSLHAVICRVLEQYNSLVLFFTDVSYNSPTDDEAYNILTSLKNQKNKLFLQFLNYVLPYFTNLNMKMQSESPQISYIYSNVKSVINTILDCFIKRDIIDKTAIFDIDYKNPRNMLPIEEMYFASDISTSTIDKKDLEFVKLKCLEFYIEALDQILKRFPLKNNILEELQFINPDLVRSKKNNSIANISLKLSNFGINQGDLQSLDNEWRLLRNTELAESNDILEFWSEISKINYGSGLNMFPNLSLLVFNILTLPHSSANVERIFSVVNILKNKQRNKLNSKTIEGLLHSKRLVDSHGSCYNFKIENDVRKLLNKDIYEHDSDNDEI